MVRREGGSRVLSVSKVMPKGWTVVEMNVIHETTKSVTIKIDKVK